MTLSKTRKLLQPPLIFGNEAQIEALKFLEKIEVRAEEIRKCEHFKSHIEKRYEDPQELAFELVDICGCGGEESDKFLAEVMKLLKEEAKNADKALGTRR